MEHQGTEENTRVKQVKLIGFSGTPLVCKKNRSCVKYLLNIILAFSIS